jgi:SAM-dependent methyltransferase
MGIAFAVRPSVTAWLLSVFRFNLYGRDRWVAAEAARISAGARVLDVGAGPCRYAALFQHCRYVALDVNVTPGASRPLDIIADVARLPFATGRFDAVLCTEVIEHVPAPLDALAEVGRVLRPGGRLLLTAPLGSGLHQLPLHYYGGFAPPWYHLVLPRCGFREIRIEANGGFFKHYGQESQRFHAMLDPRRLEGASLVQRVAAAGLWVVGFPWFRVGAPLLCHWLDRLDHERAFTVGYHVTAERA